MPKSGKPADVSTDPSGKAPTAPPQKPVKTPADERAERLAAALRDNLKRRKAADRQRRSTAPTGAEQASAAASAEATTAREGGSGEGAETAVSSVRDA